MPPPLTQSNLVYQIGNEESCGIGQIGQRPLMHRLTEHFFDMRAGNGPYAGTSLNPFFDAKILGFESNRFMRLALEAFEIGTSPACRSMESINLGPWRDLFDRFRMVHNIGGGAIIPADFGPGVPALLPPLLPPSGPAFQPSERWSAAAYRWGVEMSDGSRKLPLWTDEYMFLPKPNL